MGENAFVCPNCGLQENVAYLSEHMRGCARNRARAVAHVVEEVLDVDNEEEDVDNDRNAGSYDRDGGYPRRDHNNHRTNHSSNHSHNHNHSHSHRRSRDRDRHIDHDAMDAEAIMLEAALERSRVDQPQTGPAQTPPRPRGSDPSRPRMTPLPPPIVDLFSAALANTGHHSPTGNRPVDVFMEMQHELHRQQRRQRERERQADQRVELERRRLRDYARRHDHYRGQEIDVDNMNYEQLLALGDRIGSVKVTLTKDDLAQLPLVEVTASDPPMACAVCLVDLEPGDKRRCLPCSDIYHASCIDQWLLESKATCPVCRVDLKEVLA